MQFSYLTAALSLLTLGAALPASIELELPGLTKRDGCNLGDCAKAAAPQIVTCAKAFLTKSDYWDDAACAAGVIALGTNTPTQCKPCLSDLKKQLIP